MLVLDANVLVSAYRADHPNHAMVRPWWDTTLADRRQVHAPLVVWSAFLRIVTSRRVFLEPSTMAEAFDFVDAVHRHPAYVDLAQPPPLFTEFRRICMDEQVTGNLVTDAWIAATARLLAAPVATMDRDFRRFDGIKVVGPRLG